MGITSETPIEVRNYKQHLQTVKNYKPATINRRISTLRAFFVWAAEKKFVDESPVKVRNVEEPQTAPRSLDQKT